jgi:uncharacterized protein YndB with AHSA1/START domain
MKLSLRRDIDAPAGRIFAALATPDALERMARERGAELRRLDDGAAGPSGARWSVRVEINGRVRRGTARIAAYEPGRRVAVAAEFDDLAALADVALTPLAAERTRLDGALGLRSRSMTGRILLHSLKLAKGSIARRLDSRLGTLAGRLERQE